ncbi:MAG: hypothetical protein CL908_02780 [Deltaproteobacteria bacterium]|nr:hypothetical protein [Deltaproteobacteria bacterium]
MLKLRGINVRPEVLGEILIQHDRATEDYFVRAVREDDRDEMIVSIASPADKSESLRLGGEVAETLKERLSLEVKVEVVVPGFLGTWTEIHTAPKRSKDELLDQMEAFHREVAPLLEGGTL